MNQKVFNYKKYLKITFITLIVIISIVFIVYKTFKWDVILGELNQSKNAEFVNSNLPILVLGLQLSNKEGVWVTYFKNKLQSATINIEKISKPATTTSYIDIILSDNTILKVNTALRVEDVAKTLFSIYSNSDFIKVAKSGIEYIDLRYDNRVYFKPKSELKIIPGNSTSTSSSTNSTTTLN